ncbi:MAG: SRPBCC domain-containing protein [Flavobacteriaceae bacterium]|jgi:uncharacterized protein YndB with AHSA1/START domain|nr:SRPBCC domain-containing protein [Flavobacteriaceae bacterium]
MNKNLIATQSIKINTKAEKVWRILTDPEKIKIYLFGTETTTVWNVGSPILFQGDYNGQRYKDKGTVIKNIENSLLSYHYWSGFSGLEDQPENYSVVTYKIDDISENSVTFTWTQKGFANKESQCHSEEGLKTILEQYDVRR